MKVLMTNREPVRWSAYFDGANVVCSPYDPANGPPCIVDNYPFRGWGDTAEEAVNRCLTQLINAAETLHRLVDEYGVVEATEDRG